MALQIRRGTNSERTAVTLAAGELGYTTDTKKLYVGDGTTAGGVEVGGGGAPNFAVAIATTEGFGLGDWSKVVVGSASARVAPFNFIYSTFPASAYRPGALSLTTAAVDDVVAIGGGDAGAQSTTFSPLSTATVFTRLTGYVYPFPLPSGSSALYAFGANTWGPQFFSFDDGNGSGDNGVYFINQNGNWHVSYRGVDQNTAALVIYSVNTNVAVTAAWTRFDLEFTRIAGSPADLSIVAKINGTTVSSILASTLENSQTMELRGVFGSLIPFIGQKRTAGDRSGQLLVDNFTLYSEVIR